MPKAIWNDTVIAESNECESVEGNCYFPESSVKREFLKDSATTTVCGWKGQAQYYTLDVNGKQNPDAAWYYANPKPEASNIKGYIAFWKGVKVEQ